MRFRPTRFAAAVAAVLLTAMGLVHIVHSHDGTQATTFHPACTICQFHAPTATIGDVRAHVADPNVPTCIAAPGAEAEPSEAPRCIHASRAPPALLAL